MVDVHIESALPPGWVPEGASVHIFARRESPGRWETLIPEFTIAGMGETLDDAARNALELLDDYLVLCARDGRGFDEASRPIGSELRWAVLRDVASAALSMWPEAAKARARHRARRGKTSARYKVPLRLVGVN